MVINRLGKKTALRYWVTACTVFLGLFVSAQQIHHPLKCQGEIPDEFLKYTNELLNEIDQSAESADFDMKASIDIHELLQSGMVLFGDSVSTYIQGLANRILVANNIQDEVSFYVLRSSIFNAFSSDQGFIFITEGAIAWSKNEEELAFIMCHELAHYLEKHNYLSYKKGKEIDADKKSKNADTENKLKAYYKYSRDHEFEADKVGLELYLKCGFKKENVIHAVSNLNPESTWYGDYSWSPSYLEDEYFKFPSFYKHLDSMGGDKYRYLFERKAQKQTEATESPVDSGAYNTHPDWDARRDKLAQLLGYSNKEVIEIMGVSSTQTTKYNAVKKTCYMEVLFSLISNASYLRAHYLVQEMRAMYGQSKELDYYSTITLNGIFYKYFYGSKKRTYPSPVAYHDNSRKWNITHMFRFFNVLSDDEWLVVLSRENLNLCRQFEHNTTISLYTNKSVSLMKEEISKSIKNYIKSPPKIKYDFVGSKGTLTTSIPKKETANIRKSYIRSAFKVLIESDSVAIADIFYDAENLEKGETNYYSRSMDPYFKAIKANGKLENNQKFTIVVAKPNVQSFEENDGSFSPTPWLDEAYENKIQNWRSEASETLDLNLISLFHNDKSDMTTDLWNNAFVLESWMKEKFLANSSEVIPLFSTYASELGSDYNNSFYMYTSVMVYSTKEATSPLSTFLTPIIFPYKVIKGVNKGKPELVLVNVIADIKSNQIVHIQIEAFNNRFTDDFGKAHMYDLIYQTKKALEKNE